MTKINLSKKRLKEHLTKKCKDCGAELPSYPKYTRLGELYICPKCGRTHMVSGELKNEKM